MAFTAFASAVSIHARQFHSGRLAERGAIVRTATSFNPRPPISQRATVDLTTVVALTVLFQSTPANFTAGDRRLDDRRRRILCFNPRPPISQRATVSWQARPLAALMFQSTPANFTAGDHRLLVRLLLRADVSIHARQFHSGRLERDLSGTFGTVFQSTPANFTAGD